MNFFTLILILGLFQLATTTPTPSLSTDSQNTFAAKLFNDIAQGNINQNVILSPFSIQTCLALAYMGAEGTTADELRRGLQLGNKSISKEHVAQQFASLLSKLQSGDKATVLMANRIYMKEGYQIAPAFHDVTQRYFNASAENVNFSERVKAVKIINDWIKAQTKNKIRNLILPSSLSSDVGAILVNAVYFKANWSSIFDSHSTSKEDFHLTKISTKKVDMLFQQDAFEFAELIDLDAKALSMKYVDTDIQMLVLLPNQLDGLQKLEQQLNHIDLTKVLGQVKQEQVRVSFPKFKIDFEISLKTTLETLGMRELFSSNANFSGFLARKKRITISEVIHKAFMQVDENGTEAAGGTGVRMSLMSKPRYKNVFDFNVNHPFFFALLDNENVYFAGHVVNI